MNSEEFIKLDVVKFLENNLSELVGDSPICETINLSFFCFGMTEEIFLKISGVPDVSYRFKDNIIECTANIKAFKIKFGHIFGGFVYSTLNDMKYNLLGHIKKIQIFSKDKAKKYLLWIFPKMYNCFGNEGVEEFYRDLDNFCQELYYDCVDVDTNELGIPGIIEFAIKQRLFSFGSAVLSLMELIENHQIESLAEHLSLMEKLEYIEKLYQKIEIHVKI